MLIKCLNGSLISSLKSSNDFRVIFSFPFLFQPCCLLLLLLYCNPGLFFFFSYFFLTIFISLPPPRFLYNNTYYYAHMLVSVLYFFPLFLSIILFASRFIGSFPRFMSCNNLELHAINFYFIHYS